MPISSLPRRHLAAVVAAVLLVVGVSAGALYRLGSGPSPGRTATVGMTLSQSEVDPAVASKPLTASAGSAAARTSPTGIGPSHVRPAGSGGSVPPGATGASSSSDPHRLASASSHGGRPDLGPPDATPLAAAAGTEPGQMGPLRQLPNGWVTSVHRFGVNGVTRSYLLVRPGATGLAKLPVVVVLHGRNETPAAIESITHTPSVTGPAILVFPAGYGRSWDAGGCCGVAFRNDVNDIAFLTQTIHRVLASQPDAAPGRVYMLGFSNGGRMAYRVACADPGLLAGIAAVEAVPGDHCKATTPLPVMVVASSHDPLLALSNTSRPKVMQGYVEPSVQTTVAEWRNIDGCSTAGAQSLTGVATVDTWSHCKGAGRVAYVLYPGGGHSWPQGALTTDVRAGTPSAGDVLWAWLQRNVVVTAAPA